MDSDLVHSKEKSNRKEIDCCKFLFICYNYFEKNGFLIYIAPLIIWGKNYVQVSWNHNEMKKLPSTMKNICRL